MKGARCFVGCFGGLKGKQKSFRGFVSGFSALGFWGFLDFLQYVEVAEVSSSTSQIGGFVQSPKETSALANNKVFQDDDDDQIE